MSLIQKISTNFRIIIQKNSVIFWISEYFHYLCKKFKHKNKMIRRKLQETIETRMFGGKAIIIIGARQVGKVRFSK